LRSSRPNCRSRRLRVRPAAEPTRIDRCGDTLVPVHVTYANDLVAPPLPPPRSLGSRQAEPRQRTRRRAC
jgi:hypothetical protein